MQEQPKEINESRPVKKKSPVKKILKGILYVFIGLVALNILLYGLLSISFVQQKVLNFAISKLEEIVKTEVKVDEIRLSLFNNVQLNGVYIEDQSKDTLLYAQQLEVSLNPWKIFNKKILITDIKLDNFVINIKQESHESNFNFQFLIDAFAGDSTATDTTSSSFIIDIQDINIKGGRLKYDVISEPITPNEFNTSHIHISDLNAHLELPSIDITDFKANIESLSFKEESGLNIRKLKTAVTSRNTTFYLKDTELNLEKSSIKIPLAEYNLLTSSFKISSDESLLSPSDLTPFMSNLHQLKEDISFKTALSGKLPQLNIDSLSVEYGDQAYLQANASISDYSNYGKADIDLNINSFRVTPEAVTQFARLGDSSFVAPDIMTTLGTIHLRGALNGQLNNLKLDAEVWANQGTIQMLASASTDTTFANYSAKVKLQTQNFNLGSLLEMADLGRLSGDIDLTASQSTSKPLQAEVKGEILNLQYNNQNYNKIPFTAFYNSEKMGLSVKGNLPEGIIDLQADMTQSDNPTINLDLDLQKLKIDKFYPIEGWKNPELTTQLKGQIRGLDLKNIQADLAIENLLFSHDTLSYQTGLINLKAGRSDSVGNYINISSSVFDASITGNYDFTTIGDEFSDMMNAYLPGLFKKAIRPKVGKNKFDINISIQNTEKLGQILDLPINIIEPLRLDGTINTIDHKVNLTARIPQLAYGDLGIKNTVLDIANSDSIIDINGKSNVSVDAGDIYFDVSSRIVSDTIKAKLAIKRDSTQFDVDALFEALAHFEFNKNDELVSSVSFLPTMLNLGKLKLSFMPAEIVNEGAKTSISNFGFMIKNKDKLNKYFGVDGILSDQQSDTLNISFYNSDIGYLLSALDINSVSATANGDIKLASVLGNPAMYTRNLSLSDITIFNDTLGNLDVKSVWSEEEGAVKFKATLGKESVENKSVVMGLVYPEQDSLNLRINLEKLSLGWVQPFMSDMLNKVSGSVSSQIKAIGKISSPKVSGWLGINDGYVGIDYTNVTYHISDTIQITPDKIGFDNLVIQDPNKNKATVNAVVTHKNFSDMQYSLNATLDNLMVLNTENRRDSLFFGKVFASGSVNIKGTNDLINMDMKLRNSKNSKLNILIPQTSDAAIYPSIVYINTLADETKVVEVPIVEDALPLKLMVNLTVTPDLLLNIIIDPLTGDHMEVKGAGTVDFNYDMRSDVMSARGSYTLSDGFVKLKLQNLASIQFQISDGSKLTFNGDPMNTSFDITAYKRVKADLTTLDAAFGSDQYNSPKVLVDCILGIKGNVNKMDLTYNISLPNASDDVQQQVKALVSTEDQRVRQFAYLVALGSFYPQNSNSGGNIGQNLLTNVATAAMGRVLNAALGKVIGGDWEVGTNISSDDGSFNSMDMTVSVSRKFLDDKLEFNTNLGYRTDQTNSDQFIGDFDVSYALTRSIKLKVFNKTNDTFYQQAPTTQGIGIVYTKEAKTIKQLLRVIRKKRSKSSSSQQTTTR